ncbi:MAG: threonine aldolase family protein [Sumerlaeia bacterium]
MPSYPLPPGIRVELVSDTATRPSPGMRRAMAEAVVGDEQKREDPTTNRLLERVCELLGKEDAIFLPSGCMCNSIAYRLHCRPGDEILIHDSYHAVNYEVGAPAALAGASVRLLSGPDGLFDAQQVRQAIRPPHINHHPRSRVLSVEQTTNVGGGKVWSLDALRAVTAEAREHGLACHMDGARLWNAVVKSGVTASEYCERFDTVWVDFTKGMGCPVGSVFAASADLIREAWRVKHQLGGAMRQSGILAAACLYALDHNFERLAEDHANAERLAAGLSDIAGLAVEAPETNMVFFRVDGLGIERGEFLSRLLSDHSVRLGPNGPVRIRAVTHLDVSRDDIDFAVRETVDALKSS